MNIREERGGADLSLAWIGPSEVFRCWAGEQVEDTSGLERPAQVDLATLYHVFRAVRIPREVGHPFHLKRATHSNGSGPPIPLEVSHPIQWKWATPVDELGYGPTQVEADAG